MTPAQVNAFQLAGEAATADLRGQFKEERNAGRPTPADAPPAQPSE